MNPQDELADAIEEVLDELLDEYPISLVDKLIEVFDQYLEIEQ